MQILSRYIIVSFSLICLFFISCSSEKKSNVRKSIDLSGVWLLKLDTADKGLAIACPQDIFTDSVKLPGTLDENKKGKFNQANELNHLHRKYIYTGSAWYRKQINIPSDWQGKQILLLLERSKVSQVWIDTNYVGSSAVLSASQVYYLADFASTGKHWLNIRINNDPALVPVGGSHAYSDETQTNWNGIIGKIELQAIPKIHIQFARIIPELQSGNYHLALVVANPSKLVVDGSIKLNIDLINENKGMEVLSKKYKIILKPESDAHWTLTLPFNKNAKEWSEFKPALYKFSFSLYDSKNQLVDEFAVNTGYREFKERDGQFSINGMKTFLRGKHDACVFPLTGYPPMDTASWAKLFRIAQSYGINHYRFHSWCPPEAAFVAADLTGMYLQPELPNWKNFETNEGPDHLAFQRNEGMHILQEYCNHPSFVMLSLGNELGGSREIMKQLVSDFRNVDPQILYSQGSNDFFWDPSFAVGDDFWTTTRTSAGNDSLSSDTRESFSFADSKAGGWINTIYPSSNSTYTRAITPSVVPVIGHEVGQYLVFPDFSELPKYTGILEPRNLEGFRKKLDEKGMLNQLSDFHKASGALALLCYREEIEKALRTPAFGGFQLLDLQDYPGQGTALVGILDAFMESKGLISPAEFRNFCAPVVLLANLSKYCWTSAETFTADIELANYSNQQFSDKNIKCYIQDANGNILSQALMKIKSGPGSLSRAGTISYKLDKLKTNQKLQLFIELEGTAIRNKYNFWLYPENNELKIPKELIITHILDRKTLNLLNSGSKVLYMPESQMLKNKSVGGLFISEFWNYGMFKSIAENQRKEPSPGTMGILVKPGNTFFQQFTTENHSDWQWWIIAKNSHPFILDKLPADYIPIVQVIDNFERDHKLGILFEFQVGKGKILVCTSDIAAILTKPEGRQYYNAILKYASSENSGAATKLSINELLAIF